jgi:hypothetical protein
MARHRLELGRRKKAADAPHLAQRVIVALRVAPCGELSRDIGGGLAGQRWVRRIAGAALAMA